MRATVAQRRVISLPRSSLGIHLRIKEHLVAATIFLALTFMFFNPIFRGFAFSYVGGVQNGILPWRAQPTYLPATYPQTDEADTFYPWQVFINHTLRNESVPLWNPYSFGGQPFFANGQSGVLYPPRTVLALVFSPDWVHDLLIFLHVFASGFAMFLVLKGYRVGFAGALLAGIAWMFSSFTFAWIQLETFAFMGALLPLAIFCIYRAAARRSWTMSVLAGLTLALLILGGNVSFVLIVAIACAAYAGALVLGIALPLVKEKNWRGIAGHVIRPAIMGLVALGVAAVQLLPILALSQQNGRAPIPYDAFRTVFAVPLRMYPKTFHPPALPITAYDLNYAMMFVGVPTAVLAVIGLFQRRAGAVFARWLLVIVFAVTLGTPATWLAYHVIPQFSGFRPLGRALFLWDFAVALLGGIGLDACLIWARSPRVRGRIFSRLSRLLQRAAPRLVIGMRIVAVGVVLLTALQLAQYDRKINPPFQLREARYLFPATPLIGAIESARSARPPDAPQRVLPVSRSATPESPSTPPVLWASDAMLFNIESLTGYDSLFPERVVELLRVVAGEQPAAVMAGKISSAYVATYLSGQTRFDLLPRLGVTNIVAPPDIAADRAWTAARYAPLDLQRLYRGIDGVLYAITNPVSRAFVVHDAQVVATPDEALARFTDPAFNYRQAVIFEQSQHIQTPPSTVAQSVTSPNETVAVEEHGTNDLTLRVTADAPGWLVLTDMWAPGWHAWINGRATDVERADFTLRAVQIPAGVSRVDLSYRPTEFVVGLALTTGTLVILLIAATLHIVLHRRRQRVSPIEESWELSCMLRVRSIRH